MSKPIIFLCSIFCTTHSQNIDIQNQNFDIKTSKLQRNHPDHISNNSNFYKFFYNHFP